MAAEVMLETVDARESVREKPTTTESSASTLLRRIYATGLVEDEHGQTREAFGPSIPWSTGRMLHETVLEHRLDNTLEIGMAYGLSTLFLCRAHFEKGTGRHTAVDPWQREWGNIGLLNVQRAGLSEHLRLIEALSCDALPKLWEENERFDLAFIDGMHRFDSVLLDFFHVDRMLNVGGFVVFDDLGMPAVRKAVSYILRNRAYTVAPITVRENRSVFARVGKAARLLVRDPLVVWYNGFELGLANAIVLRKTAWDKRAWDFHKAF
jgi:predicted O-methyltransferase YrrM